MITLKKKFSDLNNFIFNKTVIVRVDLNLPTHDDKFIDITRLEKIKPTIDFLLKNQAKILLISHFGRPQSDKSIEFSMKNLIPEINKVLGKEIFFLAESLKNLKRDKINKFFEKNKIILLENLRFYPEEEKNDETFSKKLASFGDIYVNECFSVSHRSHSSIIGIPKFLPSFPGMLLELEIYNLKNLITSNNLSSSVALFGGSKISTKLKIIEFYLKKFGKVIIGGAMAHTFLKAMGNQIGSSIYEKSMLKTSEKLLAEYPEKFSLPVDAIVMNKKNTVPAVRGIEEIEKNDKIFDIGPKTRMKFFNLISEADKLLWNGPLGYYEEKPFDEGTAFVAKAVKNNKNKNFFSVAGGGDTISVLKQCNAYDFFSFISTGGGAFLEFIEGGGLPGLDSLNE